MGSAAEKRNLKVRNMSSITQWGVMSERVAVTANNSLNVFLTIVSSYEIPVCERLFVFFIVHIETTPLLSAHWWVSLWMSVKHIRLAVVWALYYGSCYLHNVNPGQSILKLFNYEVLYNCTVLWRQRTLLHLWKGQFVKGYLYSLLFIQYINHTTAFCSLVS